MYKQHFGDTTSSPACFIIISLGSPEEPLVTVITNTDHANSFGLLFWAAGFPHAIEFSVFWHIISTVKCTQISSVCTCCRSWRQERPEARLVCACESPVYSCGSLICFLTSHTAALMSSLQNTKSTTLGKNLHVKLCMYVAKVVLSTKCSWSASCVIPICNN